MKPLVPPTIALALLLGLWEIGCRVTGINPIVLPPPTAIGRALIAHRAELATELGITMFESVAGFVLGSVMAYVLAILFAHSRNIRDAIYPYAVAIKSTPLIAIAPILVLWLGNGVISKIVMSALVAFFPVLVSATAGLQAVHPELLELMDSLGASKRHVLLKVRIPSSASHVFAALRVASSLSVVGAVIAEFTGATRGIGHLIKTSSYYLDTAQMFAAVTVLSIAGIAFFALVGYLERRLVYWQPSP